eukprot:14607728-Alexandrium_andersonii.AAC.1
MSASLVGSEMCIRDRAWTVQGPARRTRGCAGQTWPQPGRARGQPNVAPVSYTHLTLPTICSV